MKKIILTDDDPKYIFTLLLMNGDEAIGKLAILPDRVKRELGVLDLFIEEKWRSKWLTKSFAKFLFKMFYNSCKEYKLASIITRANNPKSLRLLDFFGFTSYNKKDYYLVIEG